MNVRGKWRIVKTPGYDMSLADAYIQFDEHGGAFAIDCLTGTIESACEGDAAEFNWYGNDEMEPAQGDACRTETTSHSSHAVQRLLQQPARAEAYLQQKLGAMWV